MLDSINGLNDMNMDELAMDEYLRSLDEKRNDEYSFIFNTHLRLTLYRPEDNPTKDKTEKTNGTF